MKIHERKHSEQNRVASKEFIENSSLKSEDWIDQHANEGSIDYKAANEILEVLVDKNSEKVMSEKEIPIEIECFEETPTYKSENCK